MNIDKVVELIRESRKCPPGHKWDKKRKSCVPKKSSRWKTVYAGWGRYDNEKDDEGKKNGKKNGNGNGSSGNGNSNGGSGNGNGSGSNGGNGNGGSNGGGGQ